MCTPCPPMKDPLQEAAELSFYLLEKKGQLTLFGSNRKVYISWLVSDLTGKKEDARIEHVQVPETVIEKIRAIAEGRGKILKRWNESGVEFEGGGQAGPSMQIHLSLINRA